MRYSFVRKYCRQRGDDEPCEQQARRPVPWEPKPFRPPGQTPEQSDDKQEPYGEPEFRRPAHVVPPIWIAVGQQHSECIFGVTGDRDSTGWGDLGDPLQEGCRVAPEIQEQWKAGCRRACDYYESLRGDRDTRALS